jgi:glutamyl-tRNA synthetase
MILRIDDTAIGRNTQESVDSIFDGLNWLELGWDEQYRQSDRLGLYRLEAEAIAQKGDAYRDFTPAQGDEGEKSRVAGPWLFNPGMRELPGEQSARRAAAREPFVWPFRMPRESRKDVRFHDSVYGDQVKETADIEDFALLRSDGSLIERLKQPAEPSGS